MDDVFDWCVNVMIVSAKHLHLTYKELNVWLFVIIHPIITLTLAIVGLYYMKKYYKLKRKVQQ